MLEILALVLEASFRHDLQCGVAPLRLLDAALGDAAIEERQVAAAEVVGKVRGGETEAGGEELHRGRTMLPNRSKDGYGPRRGRMRPRRPKQTNVFTRGKG